MGYEVTTSDGAVEVVAGADSYQLEGPFTTFFRLGRGRSVVDSWSTRLASYRTATIARVRRLEADDPAPGAHDPACGGDGSVCGCDGRASGGDGLARGDRPRLAG